MKKNRLFDQNQYFVAWVSWVVRYPMLAVAVFSLLTLVSATFTISNLSINTDTEDMLSSELPFRKNSIALSKAFPQFSDNLVIVVDAPTSDQTHDAANLLSKHLKLNSNLFGEIYDPIGDPFFQRNGLLYLNVDELENYVESLAAAQPFLSRLNASPNLTSLFTLIEQIIESETRTNVQIPGKLASAALNSISEVMKSQVSEPLPRSLSWRNLISGQRSSLNDQRRVIIIQPKTDFSSLQPGKEAIDKIRKITDQLKLKQKFEARVRLTGSLALSQEELQSVIQGLGLAGIISLLLVIGLLFCCLRSITLLISCLFSLICGLIVTAGFATASVGTLNLISVTFAVLFIGLSVDFSIHYCLRYREIKANSRDHVDAVIAAAKSCGPALALSAIAAAIAFFSFLPTNYIGLAELGIIAGSGMLVALIANFTLLPALIVLLPKPKIQTFTSPQSIVVIFSESLGYRTLVLITALAIVFISITIFHRVTFDFDPMKLRNPNTESVSTLVEMMSESEKSPYSISILTDNLQQANRLSKKLSSLSTVDAAVTFSSLIPENQEDKLELIENLTLILTPSLDLETTKLNPPLLELQNSFHSLRKSISEALERPSTGNFTDSLARLNLTMKQFEAKTNLDTNALKKLNSLLFSSFHQRLNELRKSLEASTISDAEIPTALRERFITKNGKARIDLYPAGNIQSRKALINFVKDVQKVSPQATGAPVSIYEAGNTVVEAFIQAGITTILLIGILVLFLTKRLREIVLIFTPLGIAALMTSSASVMFSLPFNFANVIVLPLLFGLGIAGNIHMVIRERQTRHIAEIMVTTTPKAVLFSALTTIGSFGSIALSSHPGTSSMGALLTISIISTLISTLIFLPALMTFWPAREYDE